MTRTSVPRPAERSTTAAHRAAVVASPARPRRARLAAGALLTLLAATAVGLAAPPPATRAAAYDQFYANFAGEELMRAMNADRSARGIPVLARDATLESIARDRPVACPSNASLTIRGHARDMADRNYLSHTIPGCSSGGSALTDIGLLAVEGYSATLPGADIASNNYPSTAKSYATGCAIGGTGCSGSITLPWTVAYAERGFMDSQTHRDILLSTTYKRFGCGAWQSSSGVNYYACYFVASGSGTLDASGPAIGGLTGVGATYPSGTTATFEAAFTDGASLLSDGWMALDGTHLRNWAWNHAGTEASISVTTGKLSGGTHTVTWWVRDASTNARSTSFQFVVGGGGSTPPPTPKPTPKPTPSPSPTASPAPRPSSPAVTPAPTTRATRAPGPSRSPVPLPSASAGSVGPELPSGGPLGSSPPASATDAINGGASGSGGGGAPGGQSSPPVLAATGSMADGSSALAWIVAGLFVYLAAALELGRRRNRGPQRTGVTPADDVGDRSR